MKQFLLSYLAAGLVFIACDAVWLSLMGPRLYKPLLQGILSDTVRPLPAILFISSIFQALWSLPSSLQQGQYSPLDVAPCSG